MTKREFDQETRINYGAHYHGRTQYRTEVRHVNRWGRDKLKERALWRKSHPGEAVLGLGSPLRAPTEWRLMKRLPRLADSVEEALARMTDAYRGF